MNQSIAQLAEGRTEQFQPVPVRLGTSVWSRTAFALRRIVDLQLATIWAFLAPRLSAVRGSLLDVGCGEMPFRGCLDPQVSYAAIDVPHATDFAMGGSDSIISFDGVSIPFPDEQFDAILCTEVLEHAVDPISLIGEMHRVLKPGGTLIVTVPFAARVHYAPYDFHRFTRHALSKMFGGFEHLEVCERGNDLAVIANKLVVVTMRMVRPSRWSIVHWPLLPVVVPVTAASLLIAHLALALNLGSADDPLGYSVIAVKRS